MVTVAVPVVAVLAAVNVKVLLEAVLAGLKLAVTPLGRPEADRLTLPVKPFTEFTVMVLLPLVPCVMVRLVGEAESEKFGCAVALIVNETVVVWVVLPEVPVMVTVAVPVVAVLLAVNVKVLVEVVLEGLNEAVTPAGSPEADKLTVPEKPLMGFTVMVLDPLLPWVMLKLAGEAERLKSVPVCQTSVIGEALALCPACDKPYRSSKVRSTLKWLTVSPNWPCLTGIPKKRVGIWLLAELSSSSQVTIKRLL